MAQLALLGGTPVLDSELPPFNRIGESERRAVDAVMKTGMLSGFVGAWVPEFAGGDAVQELEQRWSDMFGCRHTVSVNSATSGLIAAMGAIGLSPGDEVIVPPYTMSATAVAPLFYGGVPVFVDIEPDYFCLDPVKVEAAITPRTRAIIAVNLFGHPADLARLRALADAKGIYLIEDNAQGPLAREGALYAGTIGHIGVFSLNRHKHIQVGEGGMCTTNDKDLALRLQAIRNHGENVVDELGLHDVPNMVGFNFRLGEPSAAAGIAQLDRASEIIGERVVLAERLTAGCEGLEGIAPPAVREGCTHVYYVWSARFDTKTVGVSRATFAQALTAEGFPNGEGYIEPLYRLPLFRDRTGIGRDGWPFRQSNRTYPDGLCPVAEHMFEHEQFAFHVCSYDPTPAQLDGLMDALHKVYEGRDELAEHEQKRTV